jgi:hypothetical protein
MIRTITKEFTGIANKHKNKLNYITGKKFWCWWLTPVTLATQEVEIRRIMVQSQPWGK